MVGGCTLASEENIFSESSGPNKFELMQ